MLAPHWIGIVVLYLPKIKKPEVVHGLIYQNILRKIQLKI